MRKEVLYLVLIIAFSCDVLAIAMSPASIDLDFESNLKKNFQFTIDHRENYSTNLSFYARGDLSRYVRLDKQSLYLEGPNYATLGVSLNLPFSLDKPGKNVIRIGVKDNPIDIREGVISATAGVEALINIDVPYPGKYAEIVLESSNVNVNQPGNFKIYFKNLGREDIVLVKGNIIVSDENDKEVARVPVSFRGVSAGSEVTIEAKMKTEGFKVGLYKAAAILDYDGKKATGESSFRIGDLLVELVDWSKTVRKGGIYPIDFWVMNLWGNEVQDVYADVIISKNGEIVSTLRSPSVNIKPFTSTRLNAYWDTRSKDGVYDMEVQIKYGGKVTTKRVTIEVIGREINLNMILLILIILLILLDVIWLSRRKKER